MGTSSENFHERIYSKDQFVRYYIGSEMTFATEEEMQTLAQTEEVLAMPCYPNDGSIRLVGDTIVVKFS